MSILRHCSEEPKSIRECHFMDKLTASEATDLILPCVKKCEIWYKKAEKSKFFRDNLPLSDIKFFISEMKMGLEANNFMLIRDMANKITENGTSNFFCTEIKVYGIKSMVQSLTIQLNNIRFYCNKTET